MRFGDYVRRKLYVLELKHHQWKSAEELQDLQFRKLRRILGVAYDKVPFYRALFKRVGLTPADVKSADNLKKLPLVSKTDIQGNGEALAMGIDLNQCVHSRTSGSTGIPLDVYGNRESQAFSEALIHYSFLEQGLRPSDKLANIRAPVEKSPQSRPQKLGLFRKYTLNVFEGPEKNARALNALKPETIYSTPSTLVLIAQEQGHKLGFRPRLVVCNSETLDNGTRKAIENGFGCPVLDTYGSVEFPRIGFECPEERNMHLITDAVVGEFLGEAAEGGEENPREMVFTHLYNAVQPLIRYRLGDAGIPSKMACGCGRNWPVIQRIEGRCDYFLLTSSGRRVTTRGMGTLLTKVRGLSQYQVVQESKDSLRVLAVKNKAWLPAMEQEIKQALQAGLLGEDIVIRLEWVDEIPRERTGKLQKFVSKVKPGEK